MVITSLYFLLLIGALFSKIKWKIVYTFFILSVFLGGYVAYTYNPSFKDFPPYGRTLYPLADCKPIIDLYPDPLPDYNDYKPIIYLYPTETTEVSVQVGNPQNFTHTYPKYNDGWQVVAQPNGDLTDIKTGRSLYALYWEGEFKASQPPLEGFVVNGSDTIPFLEEKLAHLGLSEREANEMIIYWLPQLENNAYNFIRFQSLEEQNARMPLIIEPKPDTLIRVLMEFDDLDAPIQVTEQILPPTPKRTGFTIVEWGGREIDID
ncbi:MAG: hypothetical protein IJV75_05225 [Alphaproteobacteria bacterium]|nr:hypothetical protein [Alphaproteobacteria bacterium]